MNTSFILLLYLSKGEIHKELHKYIKKLTNREKIRGLLYCVNNETLIFHLNKRYGSYNH